MGCNLEPILNPFTGAMQLIGTGNGGGADVIPSTVLAKNIAAAVPSNAKTTVVTLAASPDDRFITAIYCSGMDYAKWYLVRNSADEIIQRTGPDRDQPFNFTSPWKIPAGDVVDVKVEHFVAGETPDFECSVMGY